MIPITNVDNNPEGRLLLQNLVTNLDKGNFPLKTDRRAFTEIDIGYQNDRIGERVGIRFFDTFGGDYLSLDPADEAYKNQYPELSTWLEECSAIILVAQPELMHPFGRLIFHNFLQHLKTENIERPTCLVITKWDTVADKYISPFECAMEYYSETVKLLKRISNSNIMKFSVGKVHKGEMGEANKIEEFIPNEGTLDIFNWIRKTLR